jgi:N-dimethylarginine dimethylaminohydrolase
LNTLENVSKLKIAMNKRIIMSNPDYFDNRHALNPYYGDEVIDRKRAQQEHSEIRRAFSEVGIEVVDVQSPTTSQDGVYTANWALIRGRKAVLARLPNARKPEEKWAEAVLGGLGIEVIRVPHQWRFSGQGDALPCGEYLFCGSGYRSDEEAQAFAAATLGYKRVQLRTVPHLNVEGDAVINASSGWPDSFYYDIDLALSVIRQPSVDRRGVVAYCPDAFTEESRKAIEGLPNIDTVIVSEDEAKNGFACNLVSTGEAVVMSARAPKLQKALGDLGLHILTPDVVELAKGGGYIRCIALTINE